MDKSPSPDGFTGRFYRTCWEVIKEDVLFAPAAVHHGHVFKFKLLNTAFITLLPKKVDAAQVKLRILDQLVLFIVLPNL
jgi:hypothetical protein